MDFNQNAYFKRCKDMSSACHFVNRVNILWGGIVKLSQGMGGAYLQACTMKSQCLKLRPIVIQRVEFLLIVLPFFKEQTLKINYYFRTAKLSTLTLIFPPSVTSKFLATSFWGNSFRTSNQLTKENSKNWCQRDNTFFLCHWRWHIIS